MQRFLPPTQVWKSRWDAKVARKIRAPVGPEGTHPKKPPIEILHPPQIQDENSGLRK